MSTVVEEVRTTGEQKRTRPQMTGDCGVSQLLAKAEAARTQTLTMTMTLATGADAKRAASSIRLKFCPKTMKMTRRSRESLLERNRWSWPAVIPAGMDKNSFLK